jgi:hypothetical protein
MCNWWVIGFWTALITVGFAGFALLMLREEARRGK